MAQSDVVHAAHNSFLPHGTCIAWDLPLLGLYVISDIFIALAYFSIPIAIVYFVNQRNDLAFKPIYYLFAAFITACGLTHAMSIITIWYPLYYLAGILKAITAIVSVATAVYLVPRMSELVRLPDFHDLIQVTEKLKTENKQRQEVEQELLTSQQTLAESNRLLKTVLDAVPVRLFWKDRDSIYTGGNRLFVQDAGLASAEELMGKSDFDMPWTQSQSIAYREDDRQVMESGTEKLHIEEKQLDSSGKEKWVLTNKVPLINTHDEVIGILGSYENINERKEMEQGLILAKEAAEEANKAKSQFLSRMSHELRTPLNGILGFAQLLDAEQLTDDQKDSVNMISAAGKHLLALINDILQLASIESGKIEVSIEPIEIASILHEVLPSIETLLADNQLSLSVVGDPKTWVAADRVKLKQLLYNLLSNAVKYNKPHGLIRLSIEHIDDEHCRIAITDTGEGIVESDLDALFEPFNRLSYENTKIEGTGIGLTISQQIAQLMDTELNVKSTVGEGTTFWFDLKREQAPNNMQLEHTGSSDSVALKSRDDGRVTMLYVEDNPANMALIRQLVAHMEGVTIVEAVDGEQGVEMARMFRPDIILMDINLPGISGIEALEAIKQLPMKPHLKVVAVSANAMASDIGRGQQAGFDDYITKPIDMEKIFNLINAAKSQIKSAKGEDWSI